MQDAVSAVRSEGSLLKSPRRLSGYNGKQGPMSKVNFGIPEWGCPLQGMAPAATPTKARRATSLLTCARGTCLHAGRPQIAAPIHLPLRSIVQLLLYWSLCGDTEDTSLHVCQVFQQLQGCPGPQRLLCMQRATKSLARAQATAKPSEEAKKAIKSPDKPRSSTSPLQPVTPADHGIRKPKAAAQARPDIQTPSEQQVKATQNYLDLPPEVTGKQSAKQKARTSAETPAQLQDQLSAQPCTAQKPCAPSNEPPAHSAAAQEAESSAETPDEAPAGCAARQLAGRSAVTLAKAPGQPSSQVTATVPAQLPARPSAEEQPMSSAGSPAELSTESPAEAAERARSTGNESLQLPHDTSAGAPSHSGADLTAGPPAMLPAEPADSALVELSAEPDADLLSVQDGEQSAEPDQSHVAALEELRAHIEGCGGILDAAWTVHLDSRGKDGPMFTYLPPEVSPASADRL